MRILAIDPGINGAFAILDNGIIEETMKMPSIEDSNGITIVDSLKVSEFIADSEADRIVIEDVHAIFGSGAKATFNFGRNVGMIESLILAYGYDLIKVKPRGWQKIAWRDLPRIKNKKGGNDTKAISLMALDRYFPSLDRSLLLATPRSRVPHDGIVDAILIAKFS